MFVREVRFSSAFYRRNLTFFFGNLALNSCYTEKKKFTINLAFFPRTEKTYISKHASETHLEAIT